MEEEKNNKHSIKIFLNDFYHFFPIRLLISYLRRNQLILLLWLLPFLVITNSLGQAFGIPQLFLVPEYMGYVGKAAFLLTGMSTGVFIMAFHLSSYVVMGHKFPFIATLSRAFVKYTLNNSIIPVIFVLVYIFQSIHYQTYYEFISYSDIFWNLLSYVLGLIVITVLSFLYFRIMNDTRKYISKKILFLQKTWLSKWFKKYSKQDIDWKLKDAPEDNEGKERIEYYMKSLTKIAKSRDFSHYDKAILSKAFHYQHLNSFVYILLLLGIVILRGLSKDTAHLIIPAGASFFLFFTVISLIITGFYVVFKSWAPLALFITILTINYWPAFSLTSYNNLAFGLDYKNKTALPLQKNENPKKDRVKIISILEQWKIKNTDSTGKKPKMIFVCTSGGGLKLALWTYYSLSYADSLVGGELIKHTQLITGASGGMIGAAYLRELYKQKQEGVIDSYYKQEYIDRLSKDILNPILYSFSMSDWFFRLQKFKYNQRFYYKDRAYMFEQILNKNLNYIFDKSLASYRSTEEKSQIPMMIFSPTILSVGAKLIVSPFPHSYLLQNQFKNLRDVDFIKTYKDWGADSLRFLSVLRMSASFPYVSPNVSFPGKPRITVLDAGLNDNWGYTLSYNFILSFKEWINKNTGGIIFIDIDEAKKFDYDDKPFIFSNILKPFSFMIADWSNTQKINYFTMQSSLSKILEVPVHIVNFNLLSKEQDLSLSWHLSKRERKIILESMKQEVNQKECEKLKQYIQ